MSQSAWKQRERDVAAIFGAKRAIVNSSGRTDVDGSDTTHDRLHIDAKSYKRHAAWGLWIKAREAALKYCAKSKAFGRKPIVLALAQDHFPGFLLCVHDKDFGAVVEEWLVAQPEPVIAKLQQSVRRRRIAAEKEYWREREARDSLENTDRSEDP